MKKFLVVYGMPTNTMAEMMKNSTPEDQKEEMEKWMKWMEANKAHMADMGDAAGKNTRVTKDGAKEVSNEIGGYSIMQGESKETLTSVLQSSPHFEVPGAYIEVMELMDM